MRYYNQNIMKLELTKEEMACCKKFANFLSEYIEKINDDADTFCDILTVIGDMGINDNIDSINDRNYLKNIYHVDIEITN